MSYRKALEVLQRYQPKQLVQRRYYDEVTGDHCAIGVLAPTLRGRDAVSMVAGCGTALDPVLFDLSMTAEEAAWLQEQNDAAIRGESRTRRYKRVLRWLRGRVAKEDLATQNEAGGAP